MESDREGVIPLKNNKELEKLAESLRQSIDINYWKDKCNNLQSKIDKAIEYAKDNLPERDYMGCLLTDEDVTLNMILEKILDILKEDK